MNRWQIGCCALLISCSQLSTVCRGQSTHDLLPPMHYQILIPEAGKDQVTRTLGMAVAEVNSEGQIEIIQQSPEIETVDKKQLEFSNALQTYTVLVPYTEVVDGKEVTKHRKEIRTRMVPVFRKGTITARQIKQSYPAGELKCYSIEQELVSAKTVRNRLVERKPVVLIEDPKQIHRYFAALMKPDTLFIVRPVKPARK